jgi:haloalkane dehalogenase
MDVLRTPDHYFDALPGYPFSPRYSNIAGGKLRMHYVDEGPPDGRTVLLLHGEPSWSYLYRTMIPPITAAGHRAVAPDLIGFGRSDKPATPADYSYADHVAWLSELVFDRLDLGGITLVCQDWGGLLGLRLVAAQPDRFSAVIAANTGLPTGDQRLTDAFFSWQNFAATTPDFAVGVIIDMGTTSSLPPEVVAAYDAPFPHDSYKAGARVFPSLVPTTPDDPAAEANRGAWQVLERFDKPFVCAFSDGDPITAGGDRVFRERVSGAKDQPHITIAGGGHFLQEDRGPELAEVVLQTLDRLSG